MNLPQESVMEIILQLLRKHVGYVIFIKLIILLIIIMDVNGYVKTKNHKNK